MSGGHFDYDQYKIEQIADSIERVIAGNKKEVEDKDTGEINTIKGSAYTNHFVILGQPTITLGKH